MAETIQRRKLYQEVLERLMERIQSGQVAPGEQLPSERELMETYGVGRPAIREALQTLERAGIVEIAHGERARVVVPTAQSLIAQIAVGTMHLLRTQPDMLDHLKSARLFLETGTARMAAERASDADIERLRAKVREQRAALADRDAFVECDMAFHREIALITGNPIYPSIVESIFLWAAEYYRPMVRAPGAEQLTLAEHERIVEAIARHDGEAAAQAMHAHLSRANALYGKLILS
ncbi:transcriptional regulator NanR [Paraburkholderia sp. MM5384-R2]|uniref:transcriptional regulator NanR n=1 Tax=Paraburkholderia sp. MM5384-R2 TaxID=2723097 RepID=UPI00160B62ED|nr:transcriptional regulator NanR [Paraburkholderia sp. MM5384-R2]MBB5496651.1 DNA-binding FadR family transcriptional regulator [Paraburkholderia sp. MM5384-R2]